MGLFGGLATAAKRFATPETLMLVGAALKDASAGGSDNLMAVQQMQAQRQKLAMQRAAGQDIAGLFGGGMTGQGTDGTSAAPMSGLPQLTDPGVHRRLLAAQQMGYDIRPVIDMLKAGQPDIAIGPDGRPYSKNDASVLGTRFANRTNVNGTIVNLNDPNNENRYVPEAPVKGANPVYDNLGHVVDWTLPAGAQGAVAANAAATSRGSAQGSAPYDFISVPGPDGRPTVVAKSQAVGGMFQGQSPADATYNGDMAKAAAAQYQGIQTAGNQAPTKIARYKQIAGLLGNYEGGKFAPAGLELASALNSLGFKMDPKMQNAQAADALGKQLVLDLNGGSLGTGFSNADREFLQATVPGILQSAGGRKRIIDIAVAGEQRKQDVAQKARQWQQRFGRIDTPDATGKTFQDYLEMWANQHPVFAK